LVGIENNRAKTSLAVFLVHQPTRNARNANALIVLAAVSIMVVRSLISLISIDHSAFSIQHHFREKYRVTGNYLGIEFSEYRFCLGIVGTFRSATGGSSGVSEPRARGPLHSLSAAQEYG
jgi:hypothetical protein